MTTEIDRVVERVREISSEMRLKPKDEMFTHTVAWLVLAAIFADQLTEPELAHVERLSEEAYDKVKLTQDHGDDERRHSRGN